MVQKKSWDDYETLEALAESHRNREVVDGVIRTIQHMTMPVVKSDGSKEVFEGDVLVIQLQGGITGYCAVTEFREREFKSHTRFVGTVQKFIITELNLDHQIALLSEKQAAARLRDTFWSELIEMSEDDSLNDEVFDAVVSGYNQEKGIIYVRLNGQDAYMFRKDWSWYERDVVDAQNGETIQVKVKRFNPEDQVLQVSRKLALADPHEYLSTLKVGQIIAGKVSNIHAVHGIFVIVEDKVELKASKVNQLEKPDVGDIVTCRVRSINLEKRQGKVIIIDYPRGKRKRKDFGSFLFE
ncbi:30S ribosomal protein S1 [Cytobacillus purgationiresistens]|uniref:Small subunit ribosomal protein S1 n=1 Tax=Cytobacillus purgationiresistens TaxID=863449 RepID=A0ABU0AIW2_9BACI|nr:30S ribosomal protein S1 [Cytobacillus purgationiresistens]MDQ0271208.1 small subunit ribosomal protein S1 [Cytobacillus purgationiresistens]